MGFIVKALIRSYQGSKIGINPKFLNFLEKRL
jgi:hypothetical protein